MAATPKIPAQLSSNFHIMAKPTGARCNLNCQYCFYLSKKELYSNSELRMSPRVHEAYLRQLFAASGRDDEVIVAFQGGEPTLMGLDFFRRTVELERRWRKPGQRVLNTLQTNGTLLDDNWGDLLRENNFLVGISIDGPQDIHDAYRVDRRGKGTFVRALRGLTVLRGSGVDWNALVAVNAAHAGRGREVYVFLRDTLGARFIQFIPVVERGGQGLVTNRSIGAEQYGQFLIDVFDEWMSHDVGDVFVNVFDTALAHWLGMDQVGMCVHARTCGTSLVLEHNGDAYSCDHYVEERYRIGNIAQGDTLERLVTSPRLIAFGLAKLDALPSACRGCDVRFACNGGCPKDRLLTAADGDPNPQYLCAGYHRFFQYIDMPMRMMADRIRRGLDARGSSAHWRRWKEKSSDKRISGSL